MYIHFSENFIHCNFIYKKSQYDIILRIWEAYEITISHIFLERDMCISVTKERRYGSKEAWGMISLLLCCVVLKKNLNSGVCQSDTNEYFNVVNLGLTLYVSFRSLREVNISTSFYATL